MRFALHPPGVEDDESGDVDESGEPLVTMGEVREWLREYRSPAHRSDHASQRHVRHVEYLLRLLSPLAGAFAEGLERTTEER